MHRATREIKNIYGNMRRVRNTVSLYWSGFLVNPHAMIFTIHGAKSIPRNETRTSIIERRVKATPASSTASSRDFFFRYSVKTGIKAMVRDPSAKSRLKRLGILKATKKASVARPAPKNPATTTSRRKPNIRLRKVAAPTTQAAFATRAFSVSPKWLSLLIISYENKADGFVKSSAMSLYGIIMESNFYKKHV